MQHDNNWRTVVDLFDSPEQWYRRDSSDPDSRCFDFDNHVAFDILEVEADRHKNRIRV